MSAMCAPQAPAAFEPLCVQHMRVPVKKRDRTAGRSAPLRLPPAGLPDSEESPNLSTAGLRIVFIISCELSVLCYFHIPLPLWPSMASPCAYLCVFRPTGNFVEFCMSNL